MTAGARTPGILTPNLANGAECTAFGRRRDSRSKRMHSCRWRTGVLAPDAAGRGSSLFAARLRPVDGGIPGAASAATACAPVDVRVPGAQDLPLGGWSIGSGSAATAGAWASASVVGGRETVLLQKHRSRISCDNGVPMDLTNQFLIAMPSLADPNFHRTVTLMCAHSEDGAMGIVINRPLDIRLTAVLDQMNIDPTSNDAARVSVLEGGPVQRERGFVIHRPPGIGKRCSEWETRSASRRRRTSSRPSRKGVARNGSSSPSATPAGGAGQLEHEVRQNAWLSGPADSRIIFDTPYEERWASAARLLGIDPNHLSGDAGHA